MFTAELFPAELLLRLPFNASIPVLHPDADTWSKATAMLQIITDEIKEERADFEQVVRMQMQALLVLLCRHCSNRPAEGKQYTAHVSGFLGLIKVHYKAHLTVEQYAALLHITAKHLIELCRKQTGKTPLQLIRQLVTTEAKRLLFHTGVSVKEVAYELNFEDPATFSKYFKSVCGYSPADFRAGK
jgi:AraC-like DNA-binding protein